MPYSAYSRSEHLRSLWPWLPLWALAALLAIFSYGPMPLYSTRTLAVAWEMWNHGQWLVPHINGEPYSEKVPLLFWMIHAGWCVFGISDVWPRLLEVGFGATQLVLVSTLGRRLFPTHPWVARAAPWLVLALSYAFLFGLQIMYDVMLAVWALAALLCLTPRSQRNEPRWLLFGLCIGFGLLTKGPVMLLHVAFPWLLGPLWSDWAGQHRGRWYGRGALSLLLGFAMLLMWALPAGFSGGEAYRHRLFFTQTAGRVVDGVKSAQALQNHAHPFWWYLQWLPVLLFPVSAWPRAWVAVAMLRRPLDAGLRFALCWVVPAFITFSIIRGKQFYYPLPEFAGAMLLAAGAIAVLRERSPALAANAWLGTWPLAVGSILAAVFLFALPNLIAADRLPHAWLGWLGGAGNYSRFFSVVFLLLGLLLLIRRSRGEMRRLAFAGIVGSLAVNALIMLTIWPRFDLSPTSKLLSVADAQDKAIGYVGGYDGQFHFAGRLVHPIPELRGGDVASFAQKHPDGLIVMHPDKLDADDLRYALLVQPFRSSWIVVWPASTLADLNAGRIPADPPQPTRVYPLDVLHGRVLP